jgi:hypothetical protein
MASEVSGGGSITFFAWLLFFFAACAAGLYFGLRKVGSLATSPHVKTVFVTLVCVAALSFAQAVTHKPGAEISASCYLGSVTSDFTPAGGWEWVVDTGSNRFVTNDLNDFVPGSVRRVNTSVLVGNGHVISPCEGTVMVRCHTNGTLIECTRTLLLSDCGKKLMPARPFLMKGCSLLMNGADGVTMLDPNNKPFMHGKEVEGLYSTT